MAKGDVLVRMKADVSNYDANIAKARRQLEQFKKDNLSMSGVLKQTSSSLVKMAAQYASVAAAIGAVGGAIKSNIDTARGFEKSMSQLSSLTGMVGDDLNKLKNYAIELGSTTTLSASEVADAFKMIGSQQPQLLESGEALKKVTKYAITLSEAAGIDLATAAQTLSTSINQMGGDSENAGRFINVLAAASQKGAGDIAWLGEAVTKSGTTAKAVGTSYEELVANLEQLAKAGFDASTAGTALRSIIMNLEKQANNDFKPSIVGLTQAFENLGKANLSIVGYQEIAGKMFASQAKALADAAGEAKNMTAAITGTNTAEEQAKVNTDNLEGSLKSLSSAWEGFNLHLNSSNGLFRDIVDGLKDIVVWADKVILKLGEVPNPEDVLTKNLPEVGSNVDDKGNYIKRPAQKGAVGFDWESGTWKSGYSGAIYNSATGQTELPEIVAVGKNKPKPAKSPKSGSTKNPLDKLTFDINKAALAGTKIEDTMPSLKELFDQGQMDVSKKAWEDYKNTVAGTIGTIGDKMDNLTSWTQNFDPLTQKLEQQNKLLQEQQTRYNLAGQAAQNFGSALAGLDDPAAKAAGTVMQAIASIAMGFAMASSNANTAGTGWGWLAWLAAGTAAMATTIGTIHSLTGYAQGGKIEGNSYSGDNIAGLVDGSQLVGLNAGEIVLNQAQQSNVASGLRGGALSGMRLQTKVKGTELLIWVDNALAQSGRGELVTWGT